MKKETAGKKPMARMASKAKPKATRGGPGAKSVAKGPVMSRGSKTPLQVGNQNQMETTRSSKNYPNKISKAEASTEKKMAKKVGMNGFYINSKGEKSYPGANEISASRKAQRAGGKVDSRNAGKSPTGRKLKGPKGS